MWKDTESYIDMLGYQVHADLLAKIILQKDMLPTSIGIFGDWGSGKSSLMLLMQESLNSWISKIAAENAKIPDGQPKINNKVLQIEFNSWQFENYENTKLTLIEQILTSVVNDISKRKDFFDKVDDLFRRLNYLKAGVICLKKIYSKIVPSSISSILPTWDELKGLVKKEDYDRLISEISPYNTSRFISQFRKSLEEIIKDANYKCVVVYIDDLDRCSPDRIIECLEAVKLFLNVNGTAFVIGADERILEYAINKHYPKNNASNDDRNRYSPFSDYLEKLIQIPFKLPKLSFSEQETYILLLLCRKYLPEGQKDEPINKFLKFRETDKHSKYAICNMKHDCDKVNFTSVERLVPILPLMEHFLNGNPRQLKRFLNTLDLRLQLADVAGFHDIRPEIMVKLMVLEYSPLYRDRFEDLYNFEVSDDTLKKSHGCIIDIDTVEKEAKDKDIKSERWKENWTSPILMNWLSSEPSLSKVDLKDYFWLSRESIKNSVPVESMISAKVHRDFFRLYKHFPTITTLKPEEKRIFSVEYSSETDCDMFTYLLNNKLRKNASDVQSWRILCADSEGLLIRNSLERLKILFNQVRIEEIQPAASSFIKSIKNLEPFKDYLTELSSHFNDRLKNALNQH
ncbi:KAP family P-loop NTPase fold protein [Prevotella lacticifex]|jgi:hypothetical protein|uniref:KAP NTPase domain-containing protein n=1 Tax=Prevotella lacticifex TaxID=2854755 RepID=A0A9R1C7M8_9BACT|nr:P-loop NTPase fold protein [Prevotella lacticifex]GJG37255.1 hypothetical protein PRLR5003_24120 [Prevotella lacticifex]GJG40245.1 hypothetical protein PRLR5019_22160 [Prevotella lacticifex]GJG43939.1 hypothetical protein PRLR5025_27250 [Prevotella lacticifex]GJG46623.1 hypothetical protein PRLR5027_22180 [Prevotella lacticifex]GJG50757.1 hypothetical protein PRLR5052_31700 [Prevotella lacticifex]